MERNPHAAPHRAGQKIRRWRERHGLSAEALGERLRRPGAPGLPVPAHTIYNWEARGKIARAGHQLRLAELGICTAADWLEPASDEAAAA